MKKLKISELQLKPLLGLVICICISVFVLWNTKNHRLGYVWEEHSHSKSSVEKRQDIIDTCFLFIPILMFSLFVVTFFVKKFKQKVMVFSLLVCCCIVSIIIMLALTSFILSNSTFEALLLLPFIVLGFAFIIVGLLTAFLNKLIDEEYRIETPMWVLGIIGLLIGVVLTILVWLNFEEYILDGNLLRLGVIVVMLCIPWQILIGLFLIFGERRINEINIAEY